MSLKLSAFSQYIRAGEKIDYVEARLGEAYAIPFTVTDDSSPPVPINLTGWTFDVKYDVYTANFTYVNDELSKVSNFTDQGSAGASYPGLEIVNIVNANGTGVLKIPAGVNPNPSSLIIADGDNTMLNIITITASFPSVVVGFNNIRKLLIGLIIRFGG
jgi:hypothetical protein